MKKTFISSITLFLLSFSVFAQRESDPRWVFRMGANGTDMNRSLVPNTGIPMVKPAFTFGFSRNIELVPQTVALNVGLRYNPRGYWSERTYPENASGFARQNRSWNSLHYLDLPVDLVVQLGGERTKLYLAGGGYVGVGVWGRNTIRVRNTEFVADSLKPEFKEQNVTHKVRLNPFQDDLKRLDYGVNFSVGFRRNYTVFGVTYSQGLANLAYRGDAIYNRSFGLFISYFFDDAF